MKARLTSATRPKALAMGVAAAVSLILGSAAVADDYPPVTYERLTAAQSDPGWLTYYRTYNGQAHSPLKQIDAANVKNLKQVWSYKFPADLQQGFEATPIVNGRYLFVTTPKDNVYAFDAVTGKQLWKFEPKLGAESFKTACCDVINRGVALYGKNVYVAMLSGDVVALDAKTGALAWRKQMFEPGLGYAFSLAPLALDGALVVGSAGGEYGARGFIAALNPDDGNVLWKRFTVPAAGEKDGDTWPNGMQEHGGAPAWLTGTYDAASKTLYWGVGNPGPWLADLRPGDNLYSDSLLALDPKTGNMKWHYQYTKHDTWDYDGVNTPVLATIKYQDKEYDAIIHAERLLPRDRSHDRQADLREAFRYSELGHGLYSGWLADPGCLEISEGRHDDRNLSELPRRQELVVGFVRSGQASRDRSGVACVHVAVRQVGELHGRVAVPRRRLRDQTGARQQGLWRAASDRCEHRQESLESLEQAAVEWRRSDHGGRPRL
jgi:alcohol dehydrogenase (cytochrome c)